MRLEWGPGLTEQEIAAYERRMAAMAIERPTLLGSVKLFLFGRRDA